MDPTFNHEYLINHSRYDNFFLRTEDFNNILNFDCNKISLIYRSYNIIKKIKVAISCNFNYKFF